LSRGLSPAYLAFIVLIALAAAPTWETIKEIVLDRRFWVPLALCGALAVVGVGYTLLSGSLALGVVYPDPSLTAIGVIARMLSNTDYFLEQILGTFGWADVHLPLWTLILIGGVALMTGVLALAVAGWRHRILLFVIVAGSIVIPIAVQLVSFHESGLVWQGKYILPIAMLAPVLAGFVAARSRAADRLGAPVLHVAVAIIALAQVTAVVVNLHRYINGADGSWIRLIDHPWLPLVPVWAIVLTQVLAWAAVTVLVRRATPRETRRLLDEPAHSLLPVRDSEAVRTHDVT
jgi:hypothetical protein